MCHGVIYICQSQNYRSQHSHWPFGKVPTSFLSRTCRPTYQKIDRATCQWFLMASDKLVEWHNSATVCFAIRGKWQWPNSCFLPARRRAATKKPYTRPQIVGLSSSACVCAILGRAPYAPVPQRGEAGDFVSMIRYTASWHGAPSCQGEELHSAVQ